MKQLTKEQNKIIIIAAAGLIFIFLFWVVIYVPQSRKLAYIKNQLNYAESQIADIKRITQDRDLAMIVTDLNKQFSLLTSKLPSEEKEVINYLSEKARGLKIDVKNIILSDKGVLGDKIPGYKVEILPISMNLNCEFKALGNYLSILKSDSSILIKVRRMDIIGSGEGYPQLDIKLQLSAYLSKQGT